MQSVEFDLATILTKMQADLSTIKDSQAEIKAYQVELKGEIRRVEQKVDDTNKRIDDTNKRIDKLETKMEKMEAKIDLVITDVADLKGSKSLITPLIIAVVTSFLTLLIRAIPGT